VLCDDSNLFRTGLEMLLRESGVAVIGSCTDATGLLGLLDDAPDSPDVAVVDIRLPPGFADEGVAVAGQIRRRWPDVAVLLLSTYAETSYATRLLACSDRAVGYLLKDRVTDVTALLDDLQRLSAGEVVIDPVIIGNMLTRSRARARLDALTERERDVLALMAEGRSNTGIGSRLFLSPKTVEAHVAAVFAKLDLQTQPQDNRRVLAVLAWMQDAAP
jgi:DNA-binding NarL/FixJ family response regulator